MYAPQKTASDDIYSYSKALGADSLAMVRQLNSTFPSNAALLQVCSTPWICVGHNLLDSLAKSGLTKSWFCLECPLLGLRNQDSVLR